MRTASEYKHKVQHLLTIYNLYEGGYCEPMQVLSDSLAKLDVLIRYVNKV